MKKISIVSLTSVSAVLLSLGLSTATTFADASTTPEASTSTAVITFDPNTGSTDPLNPDDPNKPQDPNNPSDPADPDNPGTGNKGPLSLDYVSNIVFGTHEVNGSEETFNAINRNPYVQVSDTRAKADGWNLTAAMTTPFTGADGKSKLAGTVMNWKNGTVKAPSANANPAPTASNIALDADGTAVTILNAEATKGQGTWLDVFEGGSQDLATENTNISLTVPGGQATAQKYQAEITWTLTNAPK